MIRISTLSFGMLISGFALFCSTGQVKAQDWQNNIENPANFYSIQKAYYSDPDHDPALQKEEEDGPDELYKRWEHFTLNRINPDGSSFAPNIIYKEWAKYQASLPKFKKQNKNGDWSYVGPVTAPGNAGGTGRINCLAFNPKNTQIMWAGTPSGGLWKSIDGGNTWNTNTDNIPNLGVTDIAINPRNTDTMFMATGDGYGYGIANGTFFGGSYSNGIMRSVDGGNTWDTTSLNWERSQARQIYRVIVYPENPNIVVTLTNNGIWRSKDGGNTWINVLAQNVARCTDIKLNVKNHSTMYAGGTGFFISNDTGATWTKITFSPSISPGAMAIATAPSNDSMIYIMLFSGAASTSSPPLMRSLDGGKTWKTMSVVNSTKFYGYYTSGLAVNPVNANQVTVGGLNNFRSMDGGATWSQLTYDYGFPNNYYVHPDHRVHVYSPGSKDTIYDGNDGGLYRSTNGGTSWKLISGDIHAMELYRIGSQAYDPTILYAGAQDNGVNQMYNNKWTRVIGGDGMTCQVSWDDPAVAYGSWQNGNIQRTDNYGVSWKGIFPPSAGSANWTAPLVLDPFLPGTLYFGGSKVYKSNDNGNTWTTISNPIITGMHISNIAVAPDDNQTIYVSLGSDQSAATQPPFLWKTTDGGTTWSNISKGLAKASTYLTGISVDRRDPKMVAICLSGYINGQKVYFSKDGGATFINISAGLPNIPVNCIAFEYSVENGIYVGTDIGVFYKNDNTGGWIPYNSGLPNVIVDQIEIFPAANKIRAATYGRGVWDGSLSGTISGIVQSSELDIEIRIYPNPTTSGIINIDLPKYNYHTPEIHVFNMLGQQVAAFRNILPNDNTTALDLSFLPAGIYNISLIYPEGRVSKKIQISR
jgi:photosystem II stability/assembly factor-like uncharacterized protein